MHKDRRVLITGGAGFVGSNLVHKMVSLGAKVTVIDNFHRDYGGNEFNFRGVENKIELVRGEITDLELMQKLVREKDFIFHVAAQCSHVDSMIDPWLDVDYNCRGTLSLLEAAKAQPKRPVIVYAGTRAALGAPLEIPVHEHSLPNPTDVYGVNKLAAELYGAVYARVHKIPFVTLRLTNSYGARHQMKSGKYGILNWFISLALQGKTIKVFGTGEQLRDYLYIDDAIEAFVKASEFASKMADGKASSENAQISGKGIPFAVFNIASGTGIKFVDVAREVSRRGTGSLEMVPWPADRAAIETGDYIADIAEAKKTLGWSPTVSFEDGLERTFAYYRDHLQNYL